MEITSVLATRIQNIIGGMKVNLSNAVSSTNYAIFANAKLTVFTYLHTLNWVGAEGGSIFFGLRGGV